jgi:hypothetical protein
VIFEEQPKLEFVKGDATVVADFKQLYGSPLRNKARKQRMRTIVTGWFDAKKMRCEVVGQSLN